MHRSHTNPEIAHLAAVSHALRFIASPTQGEKALRSLRRLPPETLNTLGKLHGIPTHQLDTFRSIMRNEDGADTTFWEDFKQVNGLLQPGDIILMTGNQALSKAQIALYSKAVSSHVALVHAGFICIDAIPKAGVSNRFIVDVLANAKSGWRVIRHKSIDAPVTEKIMKACAFYLAQPYLIYPSKKSAKNSAYCSELARKIYQGVGVTNSGIPNTSIIAPAHFDKLADEHPEWINITDDVRPLVEFCQKYPELLRITARLFIDGLKLNQQRFKERHETLIEIQHLAKAGRITKEQAKKRTAEIRAIERNMNHTFWNAERDAI